MLVKTPCLPELHSSFTLPPLGVMVDVLIVSLEGLQVDFEPPKERASFRIES